MTDHMNVDEADDASLPTSALITLKKKSKKFFHFQQIAKHFEIPEAVAAQHLGISKTQLKKLCREHDIPRWPYRRLKSIQSKIDVLRCQADKSVNAEEVENLNKQIEDLISKKEFIKSNPKTISTSFVGVTNYTALNENIDMTQVFTESPPPPPPPVYSLELPNIQQFSGNSREPIQKQPFNLYNFRVTPSPTDPESYQTDVQQEGTPILKRHSFHFTSNSEPLKQRVRPTHRRSQSEIIPGAERFSNYDRPNNVRPLESNGIQKRSSTNQHYQFSTNTLPHQSDNKKRRIAIPELLHVSPDLTRRSDVNSALTPSSNLSRLSLSDSTPMSSIDNGQSLPSFAVLLQQIDNSLVIGNVNN